MSYEAWRISFQSSEAAARAAYEQLQAANQSKQGVAICTPNTNMKNKQINKTFKVISKDQGGDQCEAIAPRGYVQAGDHAKFLLEHGHTEVHIKITYEKAKQ